jgi:glycosyltransferase involved in cell wall biosynthesis
MLCGTPSIASNLPGVRQPPLVTGMGAVTPIGDAAELAEAIIRIIREQDKYARPRNQIEAMFSLEQTVSGYEKLFRDLLPEQAQIKARVEAPEA